jgi:hypothetical protein
MPTLKQITCSIELGQSGVKLSEFGARYSDGAVETFIAVPDEPAPFFIHVKSEGYIAPGLAVFVFIDGVYQANRNRVRLLIPEKGMDPSKYEVDFMIRQKEEKKADGGFVGRSWHFHALKVGESPSATTQACFSC